jgi:nucleoid DNA-binding protein
MTTDEKTKLRLKDMIRLTAEDCSYHLYEVEDVITAFVNVLRTELYKGNSVLIERLCKLEIYKPKPRKLYNFKTKRLKLSAAHPKLRVTPTIGLLDYIREQSDTLLEVKKGTGNIRKQHHNHTEQRKYYDESKPQQIQVDEFPVPN